MGNVIRAHNLTPIGRMNPGSAQLTMLAERFFAHPSPNDEERRRILLRYLKLMRRLERGDRSVSKHKYQVVAYADELDGLQAFKRAMDKLVEFLVQLNTVIDAHQKAFPNDRQTIRRMVDLYRQKVAEADAEAHGETM